MLAFLYEPDRLRRIGRVWVAAAAVAAIWHGWSCLSVGLTDGRGHPFGHDTLNFWSAAALAFEGRASVAYDMPAYHDFQLAVVGADLDYYHSGYPPMLMLLTSPLGFLPYP